MKTMKKLIQKFNRKFPNYSAYLDCIESYQGCYRICISDDEYKLSSWYIFDSCRDFNEWMNGIVF